MHLTSRLQLLLAAMRQWWARPRALRETQGVAPAQGNRAPVPSPPFVQQLFRDEHISFSLEGAELVDYEQAFDGERDRLAQAIDAWTPGPPARKEYAELREDICRYNARMNNGYAFTCWQFEQQELKGRQEAFKARIRHDMLAEYDALARACKNLWLPAKYPLLQRKARRAMAKAYPELFNHRLFKDWGVAVAPPTVPDFAALPAHAPKQLPTRYLSELPELVATVHAPARALSKPIEPAELLHALARRQRALDARKAFFAVLEDRAEAPPAFAAVRALVVEVRAMLRALEEAGTLVQGRGLLSAWDEETEATWRTPAASSMASNQEGEAPAYVRLPPGDVVPVAASVTHDEMAEWFGCALSATGLVDSTDAAATLNE